ncbi:TWiK family of potassium channels protein 7 [Halyomorpha halys]|uniref:TWiK family of potassium channels protein 7 n=1 Tax=Halyomorpha halys TaxID=286706 RepID=UPI0034D2BD6B
MPKVFRELEYPSEIARLTEAGLLVRTSRQNFLNQVLLLHNDTDHNFTDTFENELRKYESSVQEAAQKGVLVPISEGATPESLARWNHLQAIFFASTVLTTIGYGNIAPVTTAGRVFCLLFALIGIPLCLTVIADLGIVVAGSLPDLASKMESLSTAVKSLVSAFAALFLLLVFLSIGAFLFMHLEDDWNFFDSFYFCFITMTTIGFGDLVPQKPQYMLLCTLYILVGLGLTSTIIEIVRMEYAKSWKRLQALAEALRRLGESGSGQAVDLSAFQGDLRKVFFSISKNSKGSENWEKAVDNIVSSFNKPKAKPKIIQIIIYESSV